MSNKKLATLGLVAAVMILLAFIQSYVSSGPAQGTNRDTPLIQGLDTSAIGSIRLGPHDKPITLKKAGKQFVLVERDSYPAAMQKINNLVTSTLDIKVSELVTDDPENHKDLGLTDETAKGTVTFLDSKAEPIVGIVVGKRDEATGGDYVRLNSDDQDLSRKAYLSFNVPYLDMTALIYLDKKILKIDKKNISKVTVSGPEGDYIIVAGEDGKPVLENVPEGEKAEEDINERVFSAATDLEFSDVKRESTVDGNLQFDRTYVVHMKDSGVYTFKMAKKDDKSYLQSSSEFTERSPVVKKQGVVESEEALKEKETKLLARDASNNFNKRHNGWIYEVATWRTVNMTRKFEELLEDKDKKEE